MRSFIGSIIASNFRRLNSPLKLSYAVTYRCNLRCSMCSIWAKQPQPELTISQLERFFSRPNRFYWLGITGGEPFTRPDLTAVLDVLGRHAPDLRVVHFATNGTLRDRILETVEHINREHKKIKTVVTISIDGPPKIHDAIRGQEGTWEKAIQSFLSLRKIKNIRVQIGFTLSQENMGKFTATLASVRALYPALRFDDLVVNIFQRSPFFYENHAMPALDPALLQSEIRTILALDQDRLTLNNYLRRRYLSLYLRFLRLGKSPVPCQAFSSSGFLDPYGDLYPCATFQNKLLNIADTDLSLTDIWGLAKTRDIQQLCRRNDCPSCWNPCDAYSAIGGSLFQSLARN